MDLKFCRGSSTESLPKAIKLFKFYNKARGIRIKCKTWILDKLVNFFQNNYFAKLKGRW